MNATTEVTADVWVESDDFTTMTREYEANGTIYRALCERDEYPELPDGDCYPAAWRVDHRSVDAIMSGPGEELDDALRSLVERYGMSDGLNMFARYVRAFHGGDVREYTCPWDRSGDVYVTAVTADAARRVWGTGCADASSPDLQAYLESDVWIVSVQRASDIDATTGEVLTWEDVDGPIHGHYGEQWAREEADELVNAAIDTDARDMLPLAY